MKQDSTLSLKMRFGPSDGPQEGAMREVQWGEVGIEASENVSDEGTWTHGDRPESRQKKSTEWLPPPTAASAKTTFTRPAP